MIYFLLAFFITEIAISLCLEIFKYKCYEFPKIKVVKNGINFFSTKQHKIKIYNLKLCELAGNFYLKSNSQIIVFRNIKNIKIKNNYMYFVGCGKVEMIFDFSKFYKYFNIEININEFNFLQFKQNAILDYLNNRFNIENAKIFQKFLKFIKNTLKIQINNENLTIFSNNLKISYQLIYKLNNKIKKINITNTIGKI